MGEDYTEEIRRFLEKIFAVINSPMSEFDKHEQIKKILKGNVKLLGIFLAKTRARNITTGDADLDKNMNEIPDSYFRSE